MREPSTKEKLLDATLTLISEKGYLGATTREISKRAGVTELTLFRHFGTKENLFEEVLKSFAFLPALKEHQPDLKTRSYNDALNVVGLEFLETLKARKPLVKVILSELNLYPEKARDVYMRFVDEMVRALAEYLKALKEEKVIKPFPPEALARMFLRNLFSYFLSEEILRVKDLKRDEMERTISLYVDIFIDGTRKGGNSTHKKGRKKSR